MIPPQQTKGKTISNSIAVDTTIDRLTNSFEAALLEEEARYAAQSIRTIRIANDLNAYHPETPVYVFETDGKRWAASTISGDVLARTANPGITVGFIEDNKRHTEKYLGMFDLVAKLVKPKTTGHGGRITLLAEHSPVA